MIKTNSGKNGEFIEMAHGTTLALTGDSFGGGDFDDIAVYWDEASQSIKSEVYYSTRFAASGYATVDATPEVIEKATNYRRERIAAKVRSRFLQAAEEIKVGKTVKVVGGRKIAHGTAGVVIWTGIAQYSYTAKDLRVGIKQENGEVVFTSARNVEVVNPEQYLDEEEITAAIEREARNFGGK